MGNGTDYISGVGDYFRGRYGTGNELVNFLEKIFGKGIDKDKVAGILREMNFFRVAKKGRQFAGQAIEDKRFLESARRNAGAPAPRPSGLSGSLGLGKLTDPRESALQAFLDSLRNEYDSL